MTGGLSIGFTRKAVVDQTYIRNTEDICKSIVGIDALYTRWEFDSDSQKFKARQNKSRKFGTWLCRTYNLSILTALLKDTTQLELRKRLIVLMQTDFVITVKPFLKQGVVTFTFVHVRKQEQACQRNLLRKDSSNGNTMS